MIPMQSPGTIGVDSASSRSAFLRLVQKRLQYHWPASFGFTANGDLHTISAVLFLLGTAPDGTPELILNRRSPHVRQAGDLCCPGGGISPKLDLFLAKWLDLPATPLFRWPHRKWWRRYRSDDYAKLSILLTTALREGLEEMRLNPFGVTFLGPMPVQQLVLFERFIYPLAVWIDRQQRFFPNWEVDKIIRIPLADLLCAQHYGRIVMSGRVMNREPLKMSQREFPCFIHRDHDQNELLWGATYRITVSFLRAIFDFVPPDPKSLPVIHRRIDRHYLEGEPLSKNQ